MFEDPISSKKYDGALVETKKVVGLKVLVIDGVNEGELTDGDKEGELTGWFDGLIVGSLFGSMDG